MTAALLSAAAAICEARGTADARRIARELLALRDQDVPPQATCAHESDEQAVRAHGDGSGSARPAERQS